ncbi:MAG: ABC transporter permease [Bacteroidales bacterium]|nr:ABC transporter permease [Bacteroidales bacterium]
MLSLRIALRYLLSKKSHGAVNIISIFSVAGVAVATAAIVIVLSVFNGFTTLSAGRLSAIDPELKIIPTQGKTIDSADSLALALQSLPTIVAAAPVIEERGLAICGNLQKPVIFKGVDEAYQSVVPVADIVIDGEYLREAYDTPAAMLSAGVAVNLNARPDFGSVVELYVPRRVGRINPANPSTAFRGQQMLVTSVFQIDQPEYDADYMYVPLSVARDLLEYDTEATAIELTVAAGRTPEAEATALAQQLGSGYRVLTRSEQEADSFKMIMVEKWITFLMLAFILVIASFNIISTLSLLVIEKRANMHTLSALGAPRSLLRNVFVDLGCLISIAGGVAGILLGAVLSLLQQWLGLIKLSGDPAHLSISVYPVRVEGIDLLAVFGLVCIIALCSAAIAALFSRKLGVNENP